MPTVSSVLNDFSSLTRTEKNAVLNRLFHSSITNASSVYELAEEVRFSEGRVCPYCGSIHVVRNGKRKDGTQRFHCKDCEKHFVATANSIIAGTKKTLSVWEKFVDCMMNGTVLRKSATICGISKNTAFAWRHKILSALAEMHITLGGIVEADETFYDVSYKGNHSLGGFVMPRRPHKRGSSSRKRGLSSDKVCVPCAVNRQGQSIGVVSNLAKAKTAGIKAAFDGKIEPGTELITDKEKSYRRFAEDNGLHLHQMKSDTDSRSGIYHLQHINSYHSQLDGFLYGFKGVSTKYLNNYILWHNFVNHARETYQEKRRILLLWVAATQKTVRYNEVSDRPNLPLLA